MHIWRLWNNIWSLFAKDTELIMEKYIFSKAHYVYMRKKAVFVTNKRFEQVFQVDAKSQVLFGQDPQIATPFPIQRYNNPTLFYVLWLFP